MPVLQRRWKHFHGSRLAQENAQLRAQCETQEQFNTELQDQMKQMIQTHTTALALATKVRDRHRARCKELETSLSKKCLEIEQLAQAAENKAKQLTQIKNRKK